VQAYKNIEVIVVDSASTDKTVLLVESKRQEDIANRGPSEYERVKIIRQPHRTFYGESWLEGWKVAEGLVVGNSNTDDRSFPHRGHHVMWHTHIHINNIGFMYGGYETRVNGVVTAKGIPPPFSVEDFSQFFRAGVHIHWMNHLADIVNWDLLYRAAREYKSAFDYYLTLMFVSLGKPGHVIPSVLSIYNQRPDSIEQSDRGRNTFESLRAIETFFPESVAIQNLKTNKDFYPQYLEFCSQF
jgi:glycosyltransferase involved in cell wall biosynthesis